MIFLFHSISDSLSLSSMPSSLTIEKYNGSSQQSNLSIHSLTSLPQGTSISSNLTSTPVSITPSSSFKSPNPNSSLSGKNTKNESSSSFTSDEVSFLLQKPGNYLSLQLANWNSFYVIGWYDLKLGRLNSNMIVFKAHPRRHPDFQRVSQ